MKTVRLSVGATGAGDGVGDGDGDGLGDGEGLGVGVGAGAGVGDGVGELFDVSPPPHETSGIAIASEQANSNPIRAFFKAPSVPQPDPNAV